jgi:exodeoxyribonuclease VII small subunit
MNQKSKLLDKKTLPSLEIAMSEINTLINQMEQGDLSLEKSLDRFERGIHLIKHCQKILHDAEHKVQILIQKNNQDNLQPYENHEE